MVNCIYPFVSAWNNNNCIINVAEVSTVQLFFRYDLVRRRNISETNISSKELLYLLGTTFLFYTERRTQS